MMFPKLYVFFKFMYSFKNLRVYKISSLCPYISDTIYAVNGPKLLGHSSFIKSIVFFMTLCQKAIVPEHA